MVLSNLITNSSNNACPYVELIPDSKLSSFSSRYFKRLSLFSKNEPDELEENDKNIDDDKPEMSEWEKKLEGL
jgi:hypothetical protein